MNKTICDVCQKNEGSDTTRLWIGDQDVSSMPEPDRSRLRALVVDMKTVTSTGHGGHAQPRDICRQCLYAWLLAAVNRMTREYGEQDERMEVKTS